MLIILYAVLYAALTTESLIIFVECI